MPEPHSVRLDNVSTNRDVSGPRRSTTVHSRRVANLLLLRGLVPETQRRQLVVREASPDSGSIPSRLNSPSLKLGEFSPGRHHQPLLVSGLRPRLAVSSFPAHFFYVRRVGPLLKFPRAPAVAFGDFAPLWACSRRHSSTPFAWGTLLQPKAVSRHRASRRERDPHVRDRDRLVHSRLAGRGWADGTVKAAPTIRTSALTHTKTYIDILLHTACMPCADLRQGRRRSNQDVVARPRPHSAMESRQVRSTSARRPWCQAMRLSLPQETFAAAERRRPVRHRR